MRRQSSNVNNGRQQSGREERPRRIGLILFLLVLVAAGVGGVLVGDWWVDRRATLEESRRVDEYQGLGERTGLTGELALLVEPMSLSVYPGQPVKVNLTLTNKGTRAIMLNGWFTPTQADLESNQLPFKVRVSKSGQRVRYLGSAVLFPPHTKKDFFRLRPGESKTIPMDLSRGAGDGRWDMSTPGVYTVEVWYETYLSGRYIGVKAWTGLTNHVIVQVTVIPEKP